MNRNDKSPVLYRFIQSNGNGLDLTINWLESEGLGLGISQDELMKMIAGELPYFKLFEREAGKVAVQVVGAEDMAMAIATTENSMGFMYSDLLLNFLFGAGRCVQLIDHSGKPRDPRTVLSDALPIGRRLKFSTSAAVLEVEIIPHDEKRLVSLEVLVPKRMLRVWPEGVSSGQCLRAVCELRYKNIAVAFLESIFPQYKLLPVFRKTEGYVNAGKAHVAIDIVQSGKSAKRNGLVPAQKILNCYPVAVSNKSGIRP